MSERRPHQRVYRSQPFPSEHHKRERLRHVLGGKRGEPGKREAAPQSSAKEHEQGQVDEEGTHHASLRACEGT